MKPIVIKVGGAFLEDNQAALNLLQSIKQLQSTHPVVLVHGGGNAVELLLQDLGLSSSKLNGLRVTPEEHIGYVVGALAGTTNKSLCGLAIQQGIVPVGLSLADGSITLSKQVSPELGSVGSVTANNPKLLSQLLDNNFLPIISSIGADENGKLLNINADQAATAIAQLLNADLMLLSDVPGVLDENKQLLASLSDEQVNILIESNVIRDGMTVKVKAAQEAANTLQKAVIIASWKQPDLLLHVQTQKSLGTLILPNQITQEFS